MGPVYPYHRDRGKGRPPPSVDREGPPRPPERRPKGRPDPTRDTLPVTVLIKDKPDDNGNRGPADAGGPSVPVTLSLL